MSCWGSFQGAYHITGLDTAWGLKQQTSSYRKESCIFFSNDSAIIIIMGYTKAEGNWRWDSTCREKFACVKWGWGRPLEDFFFQHTLMVPALLLSSLPSSQDSPFTLVNTPVSPSGLHSIKSTLWEGADIKDLISTLVHSKLSQNCIDFLSVCLLKGFHTTWSGK